MQSDPYCIRKKRDETGEEQVEQFLRPEAFFGSPFWPGMCCAAGDALHNMRSALDHIAYAVARKRRRPSGELKTAMFPIKESSQQFNGTIHSRKIANLGSDWIKFLLSKQPYRGRNGNALLRLDRLDNMDKHRELLSLGPVAGVRVGLRNRAAESYLASFKKGVVIPPAGSNTKYVIVAPYVTLSNTSAMKKRLEASVELLSIRDLVTKIVGEAHREFFD